MKAEADKAGPMSIPAGQAGGRPSHRPRAGTDQLLANFDRLLARQADLKDMAVEPRADVPLEDAVVAQPIIVSDAALLAVASLDQLAAGLASPEAQIATETVHDDDQESRAPVEAESEDGELPEGKAYASSDVRPAMSMVAHMNAVPLVRSEAPARVSDDSARSDPVFLISRKEVANPVSIRADDQTAVIEEPSVAPALTPSRETKPNVVVNVTASQETHFAPAAPLVFDGPASQPLALESPAGSREAPPPAPVVPAPSHPATGPLKMLKLQLDTSELGPVNAIMALKGDGLDLRIAAIKEEAVVALRENAGKLSDALQSLGYTVDTVTVQKLSLPEAVQASSSSQPMQQGSTGQGGSSQAQWNLNGAEAGAGGSSRQSKQTPQDGQFAEHEGHDEAKTAGGIRTGGGVFV